MPRKKKSLFIAVDNDTLVEGTPPPAEAQFACWGIGLACRTERWGWGQNVRSTTKSTQTQSGQTCMICSVQTDTVCTATPVLYFQKRCMIGNNKTKRKKCVVPARIIIWCLMPIVVSFYFDIFILVFYFSNVCEYINMYYWWWCVVVQSTRMRIFLYTRCF